MKIKRILASVLLLKGQEATEIQKIVAEEFAGKQVTTNVTAVKEVAVEK